MYEVEGVLVLVDGEELPKEDNLIQNPSIIFGVPAHIECPKCGRKLHTIVLKHNCPPTEAKDAAKSEERLLDS